MAENTVYYYDGDWRPYSELHDSYGITLVKSIPIKLYDDSLNELNAYADSTTDEIWVITDTQWYTQDNVPYWTKSSLPERLYLNDAAIDLYKYTRRTSSMYGYNNILTSFTQLHDSYGITLTPSSTYIIQSGIIKCWYNSHESLPYWSVDDVEWLAYPPESSGGGTPSISGNINDVGSICTFLYISSDGSPTHYGELVDGQSLVPVCVNFPDSGEVTLTKFDSIEITGTWRILTETSYSSLHNKCIVTATKVANGLFTSDYHSNDSDNQVSYDL